MQKTTRKGKRGKTRKCVKTYCAKVLQRSRRNSAKNLKNVQAKLKKDPQNKHLKDVIRYIKMGNKKEYEEDILNYCRATHCNPGCKDTIFEDGPSDDLPPGIKKKVLPKDKDITKFIIEDRKKMFEKHGRENSVLDDGFYRGVSPAEIKRLKKEGALSLCATF